MWKLPDSWVRSPPHRLPGVGVAVTGPTGPEVAVGWDVPIEVFVGVSSGREGVVGVEVAPGSVGVVGVKVVLEAEGIEADGVTEIKVVSSGADEVVGIDVGTGAEVVEGVKVSVGVVESAGCVVVSVTHVRMSLCRVNPLIHTHSKEPLVLVQT